MSINITGDKNFFIKTNNNGFKVYSIKNFNIKYDEDKIGPIEKAEMLGNSNIFAILPSNDNILYSNRNIYIWDSKERKILYTLDIKNRIRTFKFYGNNIFVVCTSRNITIFKVYDDFSILDSFVTYQNKKGAFTFYHNGNNYICCYPSDNDLPGYVTIYYSEKKITITHKVHQSEINHLLFNDDGTKLFTCSCKGTVIRYYNINKKGFFLQKELRRGYDHVNIYSMSISPNSEWLNITSDKGTGHIFFIGKINKNNVKNQISVFSYANIISSVLPITVSEYISSEWSCYQYKLDQSKNISIIYDDYKILIININGIYSYYEYNSKISDDIKLIELKEYNK